MGKHEIKIDMILTHCCMGQCIFTSESKKLEDMNPDITSIFVELCDGGGITELSIACLETQAL